MHDKFGRIHRTLRKIQCSVCGNFPCACSPLQPPPWTPPPQPPSWVPSQSSSSFPYEKILEIAVGGIIGGIAFAIFANFPILFAVVAVLSILFCLAFLGELRHGCTAMIAGLVCGLYSVYVLFDLFTSLPLEGSIAIGVIIGIIVGAVLNKLPLEDEISISVTYVVGIIASALIGYFVISPIIDANLIDKNKRKIIKENPTITYARVTADTLNVRVGPSVEHNRKDRIYKNNMVEIIRRYDNGWVEIRYSENKTGYVNGKFLEEQTTVRQQVQPPPTLPPPPIPRNVRITDVGTDFVILQWDNAGVDHSYRVYWHTQNDATNAKNGTTDDTAARIPDLASNTDYYFWISTIRDNQESEKSSVQTTKTAPSFTTPRRRQPIQSQQQPIQEIQDW